MIPLEDSHLDIIAKTQRGQHLTDEALLTAADITAAELQAVREGQLREPVLRRIARVLSLGPDALVRSAHMSWYPEQPSALAGFLGFNTVFEDMRVNSYLVWDPVSREAAAFDTGADAHSMIDIIETERLTIKQIFLTHTHADHIADLPKLAVFTRATVLASEREPVDYPGAVTFAEHARFTIGALNVETRLTWGHSPGLTTFVIHGLSQPLAIVGDALFAGSMGGSPTHFAEQHRCDAEKIMVLPDDTLLASGHGPLTTVGQERQHNPFFTS